MALNAFTDRGIALILQPQNGYRVGYALQVEDEANAIFNICKRCRCNVSDMFIKRLFVEGDNLCNIDDRVFW
jgi:hypothetical protein